VALSDKLENPLFEKSLRIIPYQVFNGKMNMGLDHFLAETIKETADPILRFYGWNPYCLSLGYHQKLTKVNLIKLYKEGYEAVKRPTGGSAIFHGQELTYSLIIPKPFSNHHLIYRWFHQILLNALNNLGYNLKLNLQNPHVPYLNRGAKTFACFNRAAYAEIQYENKKIVGSAQKIYSGALLQHGSILIGPAQNTVLRFLNGSDREIDKYKNALKNHSICLQEISGTVPSEFEISELIVNELAKINQNSIYYKYPTNNELTEAEKHAAPFVIDMNNSV